MVIKLYNCVFNNADGAQSRLIDFDFCELAHIHRYPEGYNMNITDVVGYATAVKLLAILASESMIGGALAR